MIFPKNSCAWARPERVRHIGVTGRRLPPARQAPARLISGNRDMMSARTRGPSPVGGSVPSGCVHVINDRVIDLPDGVSPEIQEMVPGDCQ